MPLTACDANAVVNATLPPELADPDTTRSALLSCVVDLVQPVGADVCTNNMTVPAGMLTHGPENDVAVTVPVILAPPEDTVSVLLTPNVPVTELLPVIPAPPDETVSAPEDVSVPVTELLPVMAAPPDETVKALDNVVAPAPDTVIRVPPLVFTKKLRLSLTSKVELDASADMIVRAVPLAEN